MAWTKRELVTQAFEDAGLAAFVFDLTAEQIASAVRRMDSMIASWYVRGITLPYPISDTANGSDPDQDSRLPDYAVQAVTANLALQIAPSYGKVPAIEIKVAAKQALDGLFNLAAVPRQQQITGLPSGAGTKAIEYPFLNDPDTSPVQNGDTGNLIFGGN